jgi:hypothetical protein
VLLAAAVKELIQTDMHLSDLQSTYPTVGMTVVYTIFSLIFGTLVVGRCQILVILRLCVIYVPLLSGSQIRR